MIDPDKRTPFPGRTALPETPGIYAWWETENSDQEQPVFGDQSRPVYLAAARNLAASIEADATGLRASALRRQLAAALADQLGLRATRKGGGRPTMNKDENTRLSHWVTTRMQVSWSALGEPEPYRHALTRALDPYFTP